MQVSICVCVCEKLFCVHWNSHPILSYEINSQKLVNCSPLPLALTNDSLLNSVQSLSRVRLFAAPCPTLCSPMDCSTPGLPVHHQLPKFTQIMSIESVMPSNHLILCRPLFLLPSIFPSIRVFSDESVLCIRWPKYWSFSFSISPSNEYSGLISFRMDWLDLLAVQGTLKSPSLPLYPTPHTQWYRAELQTFPWRTEIPKFCYHT